MCIKKYISLKTRKRNNHVEILIYKKKDNLIPEGKKQSKEENVLPQKSSKKGKGQLK